MVVQKPFQFDWNRVYIRKRCANKQKSIQWRWAHSMPYELQSRSNNNNRCRPTDDTMSQWKSEWERTKKLPIHSVLSARRDEKNNTQINNCSNNHGDDDAWHKNSYKYFCAHMFTFFCTPFLCTQLKESTVKLLLHCYWLPASVLLCIRCKWKIFGEIFQAKTRLKWHFSRNKWKIIFSLEFSWMQFFSVEK